MLRLLWSVWLGAAFGLAVGSVISFPAVARTRNLGAHTISIEALARWRT